MRLDEHRSKLLLGEAGIAVPPGDLLGPQDVAGYAPQGRGPWFCKAQVPAGGRGRAGAILRVESIEELREACAKLFRLTVRGHNVPFVRVEPAATFISEFYLSLALSRSRAAFVLTCGPGGVDVESQAASEDGSTDLLLQVLPLAGPGGHHLRKAFFHLLPENAMDAEARKQAWPGFRGLVEALWRAVQDSGLLLAEINPLVVDESGQWLALDGKAEIDDNVLALRPDLERFHAPEHASPEENRARAAGLSYVELSGRVGLLVNGAGLAMATMDLLRAKGLAPANFMDLGGAADQARMAEALQLLFGHDEVEAVFLNLFGGIVSCATVAQVLVQVLGQSAPPKPLVLRLDGTGAEEARRMLEALHEPRIFVTQDLDAALAKLKKLLEPDPAAAGVISPMPRAAKPPKCWDIFPRAKSRPVFPRQDTPVAVQGITGRAARVHVERMQAYGVNVVAGVSPFHAGDEVSGVPVYDTMLQALRHYEIGASMIFVPAAGAADAVLEAVAAKIPFVVCITEGLPQAHMLEVRAALKDSDTVLIGPNTPGMIIPAETKLGIMPESVFAPGPVALLSRSGTLTYEAAARLTKAGAGQCICLGVGGDPFVGLEFTEALKILREEPLWDQVRALAVLGEIGGSAEEDLAAYLFENPVGRPVLAYVAGRTAPPGKRLGHAGAILEQEGGIEAKLQAMAAVGITVCADLDELVQGVARVTAR